MPLSLSELLNPAPASGRVSSGRNELADEDTTLPVAAPHEYFAAELFQSSNAPRATSAQDDRTAARDAMTENNSPDEGDGLVAKGAWVDLEKGIVPPSQTTSERPEHHTEAILSPSAGDNLGRQRSAYGSVDSTGELTRTLSDSHMEERSGESVGAASEHPVVKIRAMPGPKPKAKTSTKNEGQHTDKRYLCYVCNKLFTRRRSVRDHISKIHGSKTWEPVRSLEIIVDPATGEPTEPLEKQLYQAAVKSSSVGEDEDEEQETAQPDQSEPPEASKPEPEPEQESKHPSSPAPPPPPSAVANFKTENSVAVSRASFVDVFTAPAPIIGKKRPAPANTTKKGMAKVKNAHTPHKKPKLANSLTGSGTLMFRSPSVTPLSTQQHKTSASKLKKQSSTSVADSPTPPASSRGASVDASDYDSNDEDEEEGHANDNNGPYSAAGTPQTTNSDGEIFCICRKGDNHTWMIACDGGCEEWFHGKCVDIRERDGDLIDKYICPQCHMRGVGQTTWKRMCRRKGCRKPAKVLEIPPSKYCSGDCGRRFFVEMVLKGDEAAGVLKGGQYLTEKAREKKRRKNVRGLEGAKIQMNGIVVNGNLNRPHTPVSEDGERSVYETDSSADEDMLPNRGGALRAGEVRAITDKCKTIEQWRELGKKPTAPPPRLEPIASGAIQDSMDGVVEEADSSLIQFDDDERKQLARIQTEIARHNAKLEVLEAKEKLLDMIKERSTKITEEVRKTNLKMKDLCGFDPRVSWTEEEFLDWRDKGDGKSVLDGTAKLGPPPDSLVVSNGDVDLEKDGGTSDEEAAAMPKKGGVCVKNRCQRHGKWGKMQLAEVRFEQDIVGRKRERARREEAALQGRAVVRMWEQH